MREVKSSESKSQPVYLFIIIVHLYTRLMLWGFSSGRPSAAVQQRTSQSGLRGNGGVRRVSVQYSPPRCRNMKLLVSHLHFVSTSETNLKVKQALTVTGAMGNAIEVLAGFKGEKLIT